jgi:hypothetical protein
MANNTSNNNDDGTELRDDGYLYRTLDGYSSDDDAAVSATDPDHFADELKKNKTKDLSDVYADTGDQDEYSGGLYNSNTAVDEDDEAEVGVLGHPGIDDDTA